MATGVAEEEDKHGGFDDETMRMLSANLPEKIFRDPDPRIQMAAMEAERTNQMTPVLKEELRLRILAKRMERGEPDLETSHTPKTYELTEEEKVKRERRKEQNRRAAKKCREKRKLKNLDVAEKFDYLREENEKLTKEISHRRKMKESLEEWIQEHILSGQCKISQSRVTFPGTECLASNCLGMSTQTTLSLPTSPPTPISPSPPNLSLPSTSSNCSTPELSLNKEVNVPSVYTDNFFRIQMSPSGNQQHLQHCHATNHNLQNYQASTFIQNGTSTITSTPKSTLPRPVISRTPSITATLPPPPSPCLGQQSSSITLTPPPSVSSELYIVPESPSVFTSTNGQSDMMALCVTATDQHLSSSIILSSLSQGNGLSYQLSPVDSLSGKTPNLDIGDDKMFDDDEDDEDEIDGNDFTHILEKLE